MPRLKIILLLSYICIASLSSAIITPALPQIQSEYHLGSGALEWVISIFLLGYVVGQLVYGPIANRFGRLNALRSGLIINLIGIVICILSVTIIPNYALLLIGRLVTALGAASGLVCTFILINELLPQEQVKSVMAYAVLSFTIGIGLSVTIGSLLTEYTSWHDCFWVLLLHGMIMLFLTWAFTETVREKIAIHPRVIFANYKKAFSHPRLIIFSLMAGIVSVYSYCYSASAPMYSQLDLHLSPSHYGYWSLLNTLGMLISGFLSAYFIKKYGVKNTLLIGIACMVPFLISLILLSICHHANTGWFFITTMCLFIVTGFLFPTASYFASNAIDDRASASGAMSFINMGLATLSVIVLGYLPFSPLVSFVVILCVLFVAITAVLMYHYTSIFNRPKETS